MHLTLPSYAFRLLKLVSSSSFYVDTKISFIPFYLSEVSVYDSIHDWSLFLDNPISQTIKQIIFLVVKIHCSPCTCHRVYIAAKLQKTKCVTTLWPKCIFLRKITSTLVLLHSLSGLLQCLFHSFHSISAPFSYFHLVVLFMVISLVMLSFLFVFLFYFSVNFLTHIYSYHFPTEWYI
jgi:hypothetical protein